MLGKINVLERILLVIDDKTNYAKLIGKKTKLTFGGVAMNINKLEELKILNKLKEGRKKLITLTYKGKKIQDLLKQIQEND